jgi:hypothetical protein
MLFITLMGFSFSAWLTFGYDYEGFKDISTSIMTLLRSIRADFKFFYFRELSRDYAEYYFLISQFILFLIIFSMFIAVVDESFEAVIEELHKDG